MFQGQFVFAQLMEPGAFYVMDRGYVDFRRLQRFAQANAFLVTRGKKNLDFRCRISRVVDKAMGLLADQTIVLAGRTVLQVDQATFANQGFLWQ